MAPLLTRLKECGEALLVEVSEVLFNELAFFRLAQTMEWYISLHSL